MANGPRRQRRQGRKGALASLALVLVLSACAGTLPPLSQQDDTTGIEVLRKGLAEAA